MYAFYVLMMVTVVVILVLVVVVSYVSVGHSGGWSPGWLTIIVLGLGGGCILYSVLYKLRPTLQSHERPI